MESTPAFPHGLRIEPTAARLEAAGRRAWLGESADRSSFRVVLDGVEAIVSIEPPLAEGTVEAWPFAAMRAQASPRQLAFASADQPVAALELAGQQQSLRIRLDSLSLRISANGAIAGTQWTDVHPDADGRVRIVASRADAPEPDVAALMVRSSARARRRAAERPRVTLPEHASDLLAALERDVWLAASSGNAGDAQGRVAALLALLALNDARGALDVIRAGEAAVAANGALATIAAGAWAAWRGSVLPLDAVRSAVTESMRDPSSGGGALGSSAAAMRPFVADQSDAARDGAKVVVDPADGLVAFARMPGVPIACATLLELMHEQLGIVPDAGRARIRLAPRLDAGRTTLEQLGMGDATIEMLAQVGEESATVEVEQTAGGTPITGILEPRLAIGRLRSALVEATPAELDSVPEGAGFRARVQLVIDRRRSLVLHFERR